MEKIVNGFRARARRKRAELFWRIFTITPHMRVLDVGSENGSAIAQVLNDTPIRPENVFIADIDESAVTEGQARYGFTPVVIPESGKLPFPDRFFDLVYCSSVIEHVTVPKSQVWSVRSSCEFRRSAAIRQAAFAAEVRRVGKAYFVQTPNKWFPIESHTWLPLVGFAPRSVLIPLLQTTNRIWIKKSNPDWHLLTKRELHKLFPEAVIHHERFFGLTKSLMAIKVQEPRTFGVTPT